MQHNVHNWRNNRHVLINTYLELNPDIILINSHGLKSNETIKITGYITYQQNTSNEANDGSAILIRNTMKHKIQDDYGTDFLSISTETSNGIINIATTYLPPRRPYLPFTDFHRAASQNHPTYIVGDLNARHPYLKNKDTNNVGKGIKMFIDNNELAHIGPNFPTFYSYKSATTPDIILANNKTFHNLEITPGPVTPSDHIPILIKITSKAVKIPTATGLNTNKTNWEKYKEEINNKLYIIHTHHNMTPVELDTATNTWIKITEALLRQWKTIHLP